MELFPSALRSEQRFLAPSLSKHQIQPRFFSSITNGRHLCSLVQSNPSPLAPIRHFWEFRVTESRLDVEESLLAAGGWQRRFQRRPPPAPAHITADPGFVLKDPERSSRRRTTAPHCASVQVWMFGGGRRFEKAQEPGPTLSGSFKAPKKGK